MPRLARLRQHTPLGWMTRYGLAILAVALAFGMRLLLTAWVGPGLPPYITFYPAVMTAALLAGFGPGLAATALTGVVVGCWILPPFGQFGFESPVDRLGMLIFVLMGVFMSVVAGLYRRNRDKAADFDREAALRETQEALRTQAEQIDPVRADIIAREMLRVMSGRGGVAAAPAETSDKTLRHVPSVAGAAVAAVGFLVLTGWLFGVESFKSILPGLATMKANTALCFLLLGAALALREFSAVRLACTGFVLAIAGLTMFEYLSGMDLLLDQLLFRDTRDVHTIFPGRMVEATALGFLLSGTSLLLLRVRGNAALRVQQALAVGAAMIGLVAVLGYVYDARQLYRFAGYSSMALHTAVSLILFAAGLLFARDGGLRTALSMPKAGAQLLRRLLPAVLLAPAALGWLFLMGVRLGIYGHGMDAVLFALGMMVSLTAFVFWAAHALNLTDKVRRDAEVQLRNLAELINHAQEPLIVREPGGLIRAWNHGAEALYGWPAAEVLGQSMHRLLRTEGLPPDELDSHLEMTGHWEGELVHTTRDSRRVIVESRQTAHRIDDGQVFILESNRDITERKRAGDALRESEIFKAAILNSLSAHIAVLDREGQVISVNEPWTRFALENTPAGVSAPAVGAGYLEVCRRAAEARDPLAREALEGILSVLRGESPHFAMEYPCHAPAEQRWFLMTVTPIAAPGGAVVTHLDITRRKQAEAALLASENRLRRLYDAGLIGVIYWNMNGEITDANDKFLDMVGYDRADLAAGRIRWSQMTPPEYRHLDEHSVVEMKTTGANQKPFEKEYLRKDGSRIPVLVAGVMLDEERYNGAAFVLDITARKLAEKALNQSEERFRLFMDNSPAIAWIKDENGRYTYLNKTHQERFGIRPEDWLGKTDAELWPPEIAAEMRKNDLAVLAAGHAIEVSEKTLDATGASVHWLNSKFPFADLAGNRFVAGIGLDMTMRLHAEKQLSETMQRLQALMQAVPVGISFSNDTTCREITGNPAVLAQFEVSARDNLSASAPDLAASGRQVRFFADGRRIPDAELPLQRAVAENREIAAMELEIVLPNGRRWFADASGAPVRDAQGNVVGGLAVTVDITRRKLTEDTLRFLLAQDRSSGEDFFRALAQFLSHKLDMDVVCIDRLQSDLLAAETLAVYHDGNFADNVAYTLKDTPCGDVVENSVCCIAREVRQLFPKDAVLQEMLAESYVGTVLWSSQGEPIGLIAVIGRKPLSNPELATSILQLVAVRAAGELERRQAEAALRESEERLRLLGDNLPKSAVYQYVHELDGSVRFLYFSAGIERLNGVTAADVLRDPGTLHRQIPQDYLARLVEAEARSKRELSDFDMELPMKRPDGEWRWMHLHSRPRRLPDGRTVWDGVQIDITQRKHMDSELERMKTILEEGQRLAHFGSWEYVAETRETIWSEEELRIYGFDPAGPSPDYQNMLRNCIHPEDAERLDQVFGEALRNGSVYEMEHRIVRPDGTVRLVYDLAQPHFDEQGKLLKYVGATLDITERRQAERALRESEQRVRRKLESVLSPEGDLSVLELPDLVDAEALQRLMEDFYAVACIPMSLMDAQGRILVGVGWQDICTRFHRVHPETCRHCLESDLQLAGGLAPGEHRLYRCKNNMWDMATPIVVAGQHLGNIFSGQFFFDDETPDRGLFRAQARQYGFDENDYLAALDRVPKLSRDTVERGVKFLLTLAGMISQLGYSNVKLARLLAERDRLMASLRETEQRFRLALRNAPVSVAVQDRELRYLWAYNQRTARPEDIVGHVDGDIFTPEEAARVTAIKQRVLEEGVEMREQMWFQRPGGPIFLDLCWEPVRDDAGHVIGVASATVDLTPIKKAEEALRASQRALQESHDQLEQRVQERTQELVRVNELLLSQIEQHGRTLDALRESAARLAEAQRRAHLGDWDWDYAANAATWSDETFRILGFEAQAVAPSYELFLQRVYPDDRQHVDACLNPSRAAIEANAVECRIVLPGSEVRHVSVQSEVILDTRGQPGRMAGTIMDITEQVRAREEAKIRQQQLVQADKMVSLGILVAGVAHEINNPNHAIMSNATLLNDAWTSIRPLLERTYKDFGDFVVGGFDYSDARDELPKMFRDIVAAARRIEAIVTELRDFARYTPEETMAPVEVPPVIESATVLLSNMIKKSTDHFSVITDGELPPVFANRQRIEQVLINLIQNACQSLADREKSVAVKASYSPVTDAVIIEVADQGGGISEENLKHLGDPFFTTKRGFGGTGLGLWVSFNIVHEHGGTLEFHSQPGEGTRAVLTLPASRRHD